MEEGELAAATGSGVERFHTPPDTETVDASIANLVSRAKQWRTNQLLRQTGFVVFVGVQPPHENDVLAELRARSAADEAERHAAHASAAANRAGAVYSSVAETRQSAADRGIAVEPAKGRCDQEPTTRGEDPQRLSDGNADASANVSDALGSDSCSVPGVARLGVDNVLANLLQCQAAAAPLLSVLRGLVIRARVARRITVLRAQRWQREKQKVALLQPSQSDVTSLSADTSPRVNGRSGTALAARISSENDSKRVALLSSFALYVPFSSNEVELAKPSAGAHPHRTLGPATEGLLKGSAHRDPSHEEESVACGIFEGGVEGTECAGGISAVAASLRFARPKALRQPLHFQVCGYRRENLPAHHFSVADPPERIDAMIAPLSLPLRDGPATDDGIELLRPDEVSRANSAEAASQDRWVEDICTRGVDISQSELLQRGSWDTVGSAAAIYSTTALRDFVAPQPTRSLLDAGYASTAAMIPNNENPNLSLRYINEVAKPAEAAAEPAAKETSAVTNALRGERLDGTTVPPDLKRWVPVSGIASQRALDAQRVLVAGGLMHAPRSSTELADDTTRRAKVGQVSWDDASGHLESRPLSFDPAGFPLLQQRRDTADDLSGSDEENADGPTFPSVQPEPKWNLKRGSGSVLSKSTNLLSCSSFNDAAHSLTSGGSGGGMGYTAASNVVPPPAQDWPRGVLPRDGIVPWLPKPTRDSAVTQ